MAGFLVPAVGEAPMQGIVQRPEECAGVAQGEMGKGPSGSGYGMCQGPVAGGSIVGAERRSVWLVVQ